MKSLLCCLRVSGITRRFPEMYCRSSLISLTDYLNKASDQITQDFSSGLTETTHTTPAAACDGVYLRIRTGTGTGAYAREMGTDSNGNRSAGRVGNILLPPGTLAWAPRDVDFT